MLDYSTLQRLIDSGPALHILTGENGSGKSKALRHINDQLSRQGVYTLRCSNTISDKFYKIMDGSYIGPRLGPNYAEIAIKNCIKINFSRDEYTLSKISKTLNYCGFHDSIGVQLSINKNLSVPALLYDLQDMEIDSYLVDELERLLYWLKNSQDMGMMGRHFIHWIDIYGGHYDSGRQMALIIKHENILKKIKAINSISVYIRKFDEIIRDYIHYRLSRASSGEQFLVALGAFVLSSASSNPYILIDEPENSLHPKWQREFFNKLLDIFSYHEPTIIVATHSPLIVSGATKINTHISAIVWDAELNESSNLPDQDMSLERTLYDYFDVITAKSHHLSVKLAKLISEYNKGNINKGTLLEDLSILSNNVESDKQLRLIHSLIDEYSNV